MASSFAVQSPADLVNVALARIGYKLRIGSLFEGSIPAKKVLDIYAQTRDEMLRDGEWPFAERNAAGVLLKQAPEGGYVPPNIWSTAYPPVPWAFEYSWPSDCLKVRAVKPIPLFVPNFSPQPNLFAIVNDTGFNPPQRVIVSMVPYALIVYTGQVTDPNTWPNDFTGSLADALGVALSPLLANPEVAKIVAAEGQAEQRGAAMQQG